MAKTRINQSMRNAALNKVRADSFLEDEKAIEAAKEALALRLYRHVISEKQEKDARSLGPEFVPLERKIRFALQNGTAARCWGDTFDAVFERDMPITQNMRYSDVLIDDVALYAEWRAVEDMATNLQQRRSELATETLGVLHAFRYIEDLAKKAPNIAKLLPVAAQPEPTLLPTVNIGDIAAKLFGAGVLEAAP